MDTVTETVTERILRWKAKAEIFYLEEIPAFIEDYSKNYYFCTILHWTDTWVMVEHFKGKKKSKTERIYFVDIARFEEYRDKQGELHPVSSDAAHNQKTKGEE